MKNKAKFSVGFLCIVMLICFLLQQCTSREENTYESLLNYASGIKIINTHEHQRWPEENGKLHYRLFHLIQSGYLRRDIVSAGGQLMEWGALDSMSLEAYWAINGKALDYSRSTSYYSHFIKGFQKLYNFNDLYFNESNIQPLSAQVEKNYMDYRAWFDEAFHKAGFELMFLDQYWKPFSTEVTKPYYALVFRINFLVTQAGSRPGDGEKRWGIFEQAAEEGFPVNTLDDYLKYCDHLFTKNVANNAVSLKNSTAYSRTQYFEEVSYEVARDLYARPSASLSDEETKKIEDFMFHWIIQKSIGYDLPIQIHTGYLASNGNTLENGKPIKLNNLFLKYPDAKFILFHGGYPWTGEYIALGKMFPNVYLDLVWLPQISREAAVRALDEMFDCVPYNKIFWGGDCAFIEESTGALEFGKEVVAEVLSARIDRGLLTEEVAREILYRLFRENAIEVFHLTEKLGLS